ncbi:MAG: PepSY-associated TM helix domain-containing protein [Planctomycetales bacterium]|nr:PepSY-associated TM helix domain-containing protein [Planctomycetales bacterium]
MSVPSESKANLKSNKGGPSKRYKRVLASWSRWLHIYLSMFGSVAILFFSVTGLTLNHPEWFFVEHQSQHSGHLDKALVNNGGNPPENWDEVDFGHQVAKLEVAELLRTQLNLHGQVTDFLTFEDECEVTFQGPGYASTTRIDRSTGDFTVNTISNDLVTIMNDLHKGRHTGLSWSWLIDISAVIGTLIGISGFVLIFFLKLKRTSGIITALAGAVVVWVLYQIAVA